MGNAISLARLALADFIKAFQQYQIVKERLDRSPGLPVANPSRSFWIHPPSPIAKHCSQLPDYADFVVIGSGITGTSVVRRLLVGCKEAGIVDSVKVVMLEARDACSGATGRNGGHISPILYDDWETLQTTYGNVVAEKVIKFRLAHLHQLRQVAEEEGILEASQWREVDLVDVFYEQEMFEREKAKLRKYERDLPFEASHHQVYEEAQAKETFHLADDVVGCIVGGAGAIHPYKFTTGILSNLLTRHPANFFLCTNTPCTSISGPSSATPYYTVATPKGNVLTPHVIHATNAWCSHLIEPMRTKIIPIRGSMSAQRAGQSLPPTTALRAYAFHTTRAGYDYLTQLPDGEREMMLGATYAQKFGYDGVGNTDDSMYDKHVAAHLGGALPRYFGEENWGAEAQVVDDDTSLPWLKGRVKAMWSGILGISVDYMPWVGRLPTKISGRTPPPASSSPRLHAIAKADMIPFGSSPGEWIAAGYTGEGMVHAWLSGKALAEMIMGREGEGALSEWFPEAMLVTPKRWMSARPEDL
ncbi:FAD dependent oxidoreductase [Scleroderma yunnanense]